MDELRVHLIVERNEFEATVGAFNRSLVVLRVVRDSAVGHKIALVVFVCEVLGAEHIQFLFAEARVEREQDGLGDIDGVSRSDGLVNLHVVAEVGSDGTSGNLVLCDGIETVKEISGGITAGIALAAPQSIVQMLGEAFGDKGEHVERRGRGHLTVTLGRAGTEKRGDRRVRLKLGDNRTEVCLQSAEVEIEVEVLRARRLVGSELSVAADRGDLFLVSDAGAACHILQGLLYADNRQHEKVFAVDGRGFLILGESE